MICQWCKGFGQRLVVYRGKYYHRYCFERLEELARRLGKAL